MSYDTWLNNFNRQATKTNDTVITIQEQAVKILLTRITYRTPIGRPELWEKIAPSDYSPGTLRASWRIDKNQARNSLGQFSSVSKITGGSGLAMKPIPSFVISNSQPYALRVENGWSSQAPAGMLRVSLLEWGSIVSQAAST